MLLDSAACLRICENPAAAADLAAGRALEARHCLHVDGSRAALLRFLQDKTPELANPEAVQTLEKVMSPATKPIYAQLSTVLGNVFTAQGRNFYFSFTDPALADDYTAFLKDRTRTGQDFFGAFRKSWFRAAQVGFMGVYFVDLPDAAPEGLPMPYATYIPSGRIHDVHLSGDRVEYLVLSQAGEAGATTYFCYDDQQCHRVLFKAGAYAYLPAETTTHGLGFVPAHPVTTNQPDPQKPVRRTSPLDASLETADVYLMDFNRHEMMKAYHAYQKMWSFGVDCTNMERYDASDDFLSSCTAGRLYGVDGVSYRACSRCGGVGKIIPVGPDKVYILKVPPAGETSPVATGAPLGYAVPELTSAAYIGAELVKNEAKIEKAVLGKSGLLDQQKQDTLGGKLLDWAPAYARFADLATDAESCYKFLVDTCARYRYGSDFQESAITFGRKYLAESLDQLEARYEAAKKAGLDDALLYSYLEDMVYTRWAGDPMELERNLLKLELTPFPTATVAEAVADGIGTPDDLILKRYINDFFDRFERENGSILEFGSLLTHGAKVDRIQQAFTGYVAEKRPAPVAPIVPPISPKPPVTGM